MPVSMNNTTLTFDDATTQTTSGVTSVSAGTGISVSGGKTPTVTNTGVTSVTAGSGISVSASTGAVTISASGGGVTSLNGQTGAITNTSIDAIGSYVNAMVGLSGPVPNVGDRGLTSYAVGSTIAGSSLRYGVTVPQDSFNRPLLEGAQRGRDLGINSGRVSAGYTFGGTALSGTWRTISGNQIWSTYDGDNNRTDCSWYIGAYVRIS